MDRPAGGDAEDKKRKPQTEESKDRARKKIREDRHSSSHKNPNESHRAKNTQDRKPPVATTKQVNLLKCAIPPSLTKHA